MIDETKQNTPTVPSQEGSIGALIGSIIIIIILILGGWYIWQEAKKIKNIPPIEKEITITEIESILSSDIDIGLESDLNSLDQEFE
jgi:Ca2+/Na+ antiporter